MKKFFIALAFLFVASGAFCEEDFYKKNLTNKVRRIEIGNTSFIEMERWPGRYVCVNVDQIKYIIPHSEDKTTVWITRNYMNDGTEVFTVSINYIDFINAIKD